MTPLHYAGLTENFELGKLLLENGADATIQDHDGLTPSESSSSAKWKQLFAE